jgi:hypothetical protein
LTSAVIFLAAIEHLVKGGVVMRLLAGRLPVGDPARDQLHQELVERHHAALLAGLDEGADLVGLPLADEVADGRHALHDLEGCHPALLVAGLDQRLREHADEVDGELHPHLLLLVRREDVNDAVNGLDGIGRV